MEVHETKLLIYPTKIPSEFSGAGNLKFYEELYEKNTFCDVADNFSNCF